MLVKRNSFLAASISQIVKSIKCPTNDTMVQLTQPKYGFPLVICIFLATASYVLTGKSICSVQIISNEIRDTIVVFLLN